MFLSIFLSCCLASPLLFCLLPWRQGSAGFCTPGPAPPPDPQRSGEHAPGQGHAHHHQVQAERPRLQRRSFKSVCKMPFFCHRPHLETRKRVAMSSSSTPRGWCVCWSRERCPSSPHRCLKCHTLSVWTVIFDSRVQKHYLFRFTLHVNTVWPALTAVTLFNAPVSE